MIFKVFYQPTQAVAPTRELTQSLYIQGESKRQILEVLETNTEYNIEHLEVLEGAMLEYEKEHADFELVEF